MTFEYNEQTAAVEALLFAAGEAVRLERIAAALAMKPPEVEKILLRLGDEYAFERRGIRLVHMEDKWQLCSAPEYADMIRKTLEIRKPARLSQPALEVLSIIAYHQPVTRAQVDQIRGVDSAYTISLLLERDLIASCGKLQVAGRPRLYRTTEQFLRAFHLTSLKELPSPEDMTEDMGEDTVL